MTSSKGLPAELELAREVATILLDQSAVTINPGRPFVYASGIVSPIYCDLRLLMSSPSSRERMVELLTDSIIQRGDDPSVDVIAGVATAGIPWAAWVAHGLNKSMAYVREGAKGHGKGQQVEGRVSPGQRAIVVEDLTSTGGSALSAVEALRLSGARVGQCFSILTYEFPMAREAYSRAEVEQVSLCGIGSLLEVATSSRQITPVEENAVREWLDKGPLVASRVDPTNP